MPKATRRLLTDMLTKTLQEKTVPWPYRDAFHIVKLLNQDKFFIDLQVSYSCDVQFIEKDPQVFIDRTVDAVVNFGDDVRVVEATCFHNCYSWECRVLCRRWDFRDPNSADNTPTLVGSEDLS